MSNKSPKGQNRPLGAKAYAAIAAVEGLRLDEAGRKRLDKTKGLPGDQRRAEVLRAYKSGKSAKK